MEYPIIPLTGLPVFDYFFTIVSAPMPVVITICLMLKIATRS